MRKIFSEKSIYGYAIGGLVVLAVIAVSFIAINGVVKAQAVQSRANEIIGLLNTLKGASETDKLIVLATINKKVSDKIGQIALGGEVANYCAGDETVTNMCNVAFSDLLIEPAKDGTGSFISTVTTTPSLSTYFPLRLTMDLSATSSAKGATQNVIAYYTNTGADKVIDWVGYDFTTQIGAFAASLQCSTSTWVGGVEGVSLSATSTAGIMASSTVATTFDSGDNGTIRDVNSYPGTSIVANNNGLAGTSTSFLLKNGEVFFCTWTPYTATSSASFTAAGGFTGTGRILGNIYAR